jgi:alpha-1,2-mannosyltransferase
VPEQFHTPVVPRQATVPALTGIPQTIAIAPVRPHPSQIDRIVVAAGILAAAVVIAVFAAPWRPQMLDLEVYRLGASTLLHGGDVYAAIYPGTDLAFTYPIFAAILFVPFAVIPTAMAHLAVLAVSLAALWVIVHLTVRELGGPRDALMWSVPIALVAVTAHPVLQTLLFGQINLVLVALVLADVLANRGRWRGVGVGIATGVKLVPGAFIVYFLVTGQRRAAVVSAVTTAATIGLGFALAPTASWAYWSDYAFNADRVGGVAYVTNQSILGISARVLRDPHPPRALTLGLSAVVIVVAILIARRLDHAGERLAAVSVVAIGALLASPISWSHHWVWFIPCVGAMVPWAGRFRWRWAALITGTTVMWSGPMQYLPKAGLRELHHTPPQEIVANIYGALAVAFLVWSALAARSGRLARSAQASARQSTTS